MKKFLFLLLFPVVVFAQTPCEGNGCFRLWRSPTNTNTVTPTSTPTQTPTLTQIPTDSPTPTQTFTQTPTFTFTSTPTPGGCNPCFNNATFTPTQTFTQTPTFTFTSTPTLTPTPTVTATIVSITPGYGMTGGGQLTTSRVFTDKWTAALWTQANLGGL